MNFLGAPVIPVDCRGTVPYAPSPTVPLLSFAFQIHNQMDLEGLSILGRFLDIRAEAFVSYSYPTPSTRLITQT